MAGAFTVVMENQTIVANATLVIVHTESTLGTAGSIIEVVRATASQDGTATSQQLGILLARRSGPIPPPPPPRTSSGRQPPVSPVVLPVRREHRELTHQQRELGQ